MKHDPEVRISYSDRNRYISEENYHAAAYRCYFLDKTKYSSLLYIAWLPKYGGTLLENTRGESIL